MEIKNKGRQLGLATSLIGGAMLVLSTNSTAAEMDHSQHQGMDHSSHAGMDHSKHAQAASHIHHQHGAGQWMFEFRHMRMNMEKLLDGSDAVSTFEISGAHMPAPGTNNMNTPYMMAPTEMTMEMNMFMVMYGLSDKLSIMGMGHYLKNDMDMVMHMYTPVAMGGMYAGDMFGSMDTSGIGDTQVGAMYNVDKNMTAGVMLSIPTGDIDQKVDMNMSGTNILTMMPMMSSRTGMQAPYAMQLGTGTYDLIPFIQYITASGMWTYGGKAEYRYHIGENDNDYTWGDKLTLSGWAKNRVNDMWSVTGRVDYMDQDEIDGQDPMIMVMMAPTSDPDNYGGKRIDLTLDVTAATGPHNFGLAFTRPVKYDLNGIQMKLQNIVTLSYMYMM